MCHPLVTPVSGPRNFIMFINDLTTTAPIYKYVDDSTIFEVCKEGDISQIQESVDMVDICEAGQIIYRSIPVL